MDDRRVLLITGTSKGIGRYLAEYYTRQGDLVIGCSRYAFSTDLPNYYHYTLDIADEEKVKEMFLDIKKKLNRLDVLINNAGIASMNHSLLTPLATVEKIFKTNVFGTFLMCREALKLMKNKNSGRIVNFLTVALPLKLEGEAAYVASKAAVKSLTEVLAKEAIDFGVTVNAIGPTPIETDLIKNVPEEKIRQLLEKQTIKKMGDFADISNVIDFFIKPESNFITGQILYLGGV